MTTHQMLTVRANAALGRLTTLQRRAERVSAPTALVIRPALRELSDALEELQVANDQLQQQVEELSAARAEAFSWRSQFQEFLEVMPVPCVWTSTVGEINQANPSAAALLNVSAIHLSGRALLLFLTERQRFSDALTALNTGSSVIEIAATLRPRERRARSIRLIGRKLAASDRVCWFLREVPGQTATLEPLG